MEFPDFLVPIGNPYSAQTQIYIPVAINPKAITYMHPNSINTTNLSK